MTNEKKKQELCNKILQTVHGMRKFQRDSIEKYNKYFYSLVEGYANGVINKETWSDTVDSYSRRLYNRSMHAS